MSEYWIGRAVADEAAAAKVAENASKEIRQLYKTQYLKVEGHLTRLYAKAMANGTLSRTELWSYTEWSALEKSLRMFAADVVKFDNDKIDKTLRAVFVQVIGEDALPYINGQYILPTEALQVLSHAWSGEHYSARIWKNTAAIADRMKNEMQDMLIQGKPLSDIRKQLEYEFGVSYRQADMIVRTESSYVYNKATLYKARNDGFGKVMWITEKNAAGVCDICAARHHHIYRVDSVPQIPAHPRCRCTIGAIGESYVLPDDTVDETGAQ